MSYKFDSFEEQQSIYLPERAEYISLPIIVNGQIQHPPPHIQQITNEEEPIMQYSLSTSMPITPHNTKNVNSSQCINYDFNEQISSNVHYSPTQMPHNNDDYNYNIPTAQYSTSCSIPVQQYVDDSTSHYPSTFTPYNSAETQQICDKNPQQPVLNFPLPYDNLCDDSNTIFRIEIPGFEVIINPSTLTNGYHIIDDSNSQYSLQPPTITQYDFHNNTETQQICDKNQQQPILNPSFPHDNLHINSHGYKFEIPGFDIIINPLT
ncbi:hypothetical protein RclHR1_05050005 [Rhizophagus clarus]|uniref:Uncharacterized protein n=1 Tax=Rhizophagus clarus TaxID=94130 RepID=A0A2Z6S2G0_9GLOM|nr:hypothetical protein RclHR1_05050005 [Rhizophagus clarus]GES80973.1 hypothetical protein GLOIN_2v1511634 [Rhizophagus clarus]